MFFSGREERRYDMNRKNSTSICRSALSSLAGVDNRTMVDVAEMSMRSNGIDENHQREAIDVLMSERKAANTDFNL